ncbi:MFS transporter [Rhodococcus phenolicus]|uniref:MFS transporter n=1 Tax=Rhodococcus phenolicus TaxID=263849 RepID=UPI00082ECFAB|nr:MFS transporter [Rhodococcus phenolicus]
MDSPVPSTRPGLVVGGLAFAGVVTTLMSTLVVPLLGQLPLLLDTSAANASWVVTVTVLAGAVITPVTGRLGDLLGARRVMLLCTIPLVLGSFVCAVATSLTPMLVGRALQGMGFGMIPLGISALRSLVPPDRLPSAIAMMSASMGIGGALGLPLAAVVAEHADWRALFWGVGALSVLIAVLIRWFVPHTPAHATGRRFDRFGAVGLGAGLVFLLLALSKGGDWGWTSGVTLAFAAGAIVVLPAWALWERRTRDPLVDLAVASGRQVLLTNTVTAVIGFSLFIQSLVVPQIRQLPAETGHGLGQSMVAMGVWCAPAGIVMMAAAPLAARLMSFRGPRVTLFAGCLVIAAGYGLSLIAMNSSWGLLVVTCSIAAGVGLAYAALPALIMGAVPASEISSATSVNTLIRSIGNTVSAAVTGVVLAHLTVEFAGHPVPSETGFLAILAIGLVSALVAAAITLTIPGRRAGSPESADAGAESPAESKV